MFFAEGGTGALVHALVELFDDLGGVLRLGARSRRSSSTAVASRGVRLAGGAARAGATSSCRNADVAWTYRHLIDPRHRAATPTGSSNACASRCPSSSSYFGTSRTYPDLAHHTILFGPRYEGCSTTSSHKRLAPDFSLYLHAPTRTRPVARAAGLRDVLRALARAEPARRDVDWERDARSAYATRSSTASSARALPDLRQHIVTERLFTPQDFRDRARRRSTARPSLAPG